MKDGNLVVGFIRSAHGIAGEFKVESASGYYEHIAALKEVTLRKDSMSKICAVEAVRYGGSALYMKLAGIDSPEDVKKYINWGLSVPREFAHPLSENEYYIEDLKGCSLVWNSFGAAVESAPVVTGKITDVLEGGAGYLFEVLLSESCEVLSDKVKFASNGTLRKVLVPFTEKHIGKVDVDKKTIQLMHLWILE